MKPLRPMPSHFCQLLFQFSFSKLTQPTGQRLSKIRTLEKNISIGPILFLYYEEILVSSNLNSKQHRFHGAHPNVDASLMKYQNYRH